MVEFRQLLPAIRAYATQMRRYRAHEALWADADTFAELLALMQQFVRGELENWPGHLGPRDPETVEIAEALAHVNGQGFLTTGSQPGADDPPWRQRASVEGHATDELLVRLTNLVRAAPAGTLQMTYARVERQRRNDYSQAVAVTLVGGQEYTSFGAGLSRKAIADMWLGIEDDLLDQILGMWQVMIYDQRWGQHPLLWERLLSL